MTTAYRPMLAEMAQAPFDSPDFTFEPKWDGTRALVYCSPQGVRIVGRSGADYTANFPEARPRLEAASAVLDGELVVLGPEGKPSFPLVERRVHTGDPLRVRLLAQTLPAVFFVFDLLELEGTPLIHQALGLRRRFLEERLMATPAVRLTPQVVEQGIALFAQIRRMGMEGVMAKRLASPYLPGVRSPHWLKIKVRREGIFTVVGVTRGEGAREGVVGALVLAEETPQGLTAVGEVGTGFTQAELADLTQLLAGLAGPCPLSPPPPVQNRWFWTRPTLKVKVAYLERTEDGRLRFPSYQGRSKLHPAAGGGERGKSCPEGG